MTTTLHPNSRALLHQRIATKQAQQAARREHAAALAALIEREDTAITNLRAQLNRQDGCTCGQPNADTAPTAPSAADQFSKPKTIP